MNDGLHFEIQVVGGVEGPHVALMKLDATGGGTGRRLCGPKAWGGGSALHSWQVDPQRLLDDVLEVTGLAAPEPDAQAEAVRETIREQREWQDQAFRFFRRLVLMHFNPMPVEQSQHEEEEERLVFDIVGWFAAQGEDITAPDRQPSPLPTSEPVDWAPQGGNR